MMKVMLIDDDVPMLEYAAHLLGALDMELQLVASASGSAQALEAFHATLPDLVIIDIGLPGMDGFELAEAFRITKPEVRLLFLTCYEDFQYSKRAFQLEADDYLIKDELSLEQLKGSLLKAMSRFRSREELLEHYSFRQTVERNKEVLLQSLLKQMLSPGTDAADTLSLSERLGISWKLPYFRQGFIHVDAASLIERYSYEDVRLIHFAANNIAMELSAEHKAITPILTPESGIYLIWNVSEPDASYQPLIEFMESVRAKVDLYLKVKAKGFYSEETVRLQHFDTVYKKLNECRDDRFYESNPDAEAVAAVGPRATFRPMTERGWEKERRMLSLALEEGNAAWIDMAMNPWIQHVAAERLLPRLVKDICNDLVRQMVFESNGVAESRFFVLLEQAVHVDEAARLTKRELRNLWRQHTLTPVPAQGKDVRLQAIDRYLEEHVDRMITSVDMADHLHLNASYFSRYFKKLAGVNFTDYVNQFKMNMAIAMLSRQNETVENVAYALGFSDRAYFSKVFKKYSGKSPSEYKNQMNAPGETAE